MFSMFAFNTHAQNTTTDQWSMFHHDLTHSGHSNSSAPNSNSTAWIFSMPDNIYLNKHQKTGKAVGFLAVLGLSLLIFLVFIIILGVILLALSYFGIIKLPTPP